MCAWVRPCAGEFKGLAQRLVWMGCAVAMLRSVRLVFWAAVREGMSIDAAARRAGVSSRAGHRWFAQAGGVKPVAAPIAAPTAEPVAAPTAEPVAEPTAAGYRRLSILEREQIHAGMERGESIRMIAAGLGRAPSTVKREIDKNLFHQRYGSPGSRGPKRRVPWNYSPHRAQLRAERRARCRARPAKLVLNQRLRQEVQNRLSDEHSPAQIAWRLRRDFPDDPEMWVSHETIYQSLYVQGRGALRRDLHTRLRTGRALRRPRRRSDERRGRIPGMVNISERPAEVADRAVPGHWEGDLIMGGTASRSAIGTLVERTTRFVMLLHLPQGHGAEAVEQAMIATMSQLPEVLRKTLTWDQGREMSNHIRIAAATDLEIYFCDPHSPWQRGSNENTNGLLRQYFPKGADLSVFQADYLDHVARKLNNRPRATLDWKTPAEALDELLSNPTGPTGVALAD
ncbi:IS30 family transposase [Nocardioides zeae]|uniref:IS30 family transposase n=1 Tax=Nocardioides zeae TaxID=1457234 RepID=UPI0037C98FA1